MSGDDDADARPDGPEQGAPGLAGVLKRGAGMAAAGLIIVQLVTIVQTLVLGRLLGPHEVGVFAAGSVLMGFLIVFVQSGLSHALIQRETDLESAANTVLVATFATGLVLALATLAASPLIGALFSDPEIGLVAAATSGMMLLHSLSSVPDALMQRAFRFSRRLVIDPAVAIVFAVVSIVFAVRGFGAWAMVIGSYASITTWVILSWWLAKWHPFKSRFSFRALREMVWFSLPLLADGLAERLREVFEQVLVGRVLGTTSLGNYRYSYRIASMPSAAITQICGYVLFPAFSRISGDSARFRESFLRALGWVWFAALPIAALLVVFGQPLIVILLGEEWREAGTGAAAMGGLGLGVALTSVAAEAMKGAGRSSLLNWLTAISVVVCIPLVVLLLPFGLLGVGIAISVGYLVMAVASIVLARRVVDFTYRDVVNRLAPTTLAALTAFGVALSAHHLVARSANYDGWTGLGWIAAQAVLLVIVYVVALRVISPHWYRSVRDAVSTFAGRLRRQRRGQVESETGESVWV